MNSQQIVLCLLSIGISANASLVAADEDLDPKPVIEARQSALRDIGAAFKAINDELRKATPSLPSIRQHSRQIDDLTRHQGAWFPAGTGPDSDVITAAKAEIWEQPAQFKSAQAAFAEQASKLAKIAAGSDVGAIKAQWLAVGKTCKGCHETFREEDD